MAVRWIRQRLTLRRVIALFLLAATAPAIIAFVARAATTAAIRFEVQAIRMDADGDVVLTTILRYEPRSALVLVGLCPKELRISLRQVAVGSYCTILGVSAEYLRDDPVALVLGPSAQAESSFTRVTLSPNRPLQDEICVSITPTPSSRYLRFLKRTDTLPMRLRLATTVNDVWERSAFIERLWALTARFPVVQRLRPFQPSGDIDPAPRELTTNLFAVDPQQLWADFDQRQTEKP